MILNRIISFSRGITVRQIMGKTFFFKFLYFQEKRMVFILFMQMIIFLLRCYLLLAVNLILRTERTAKKKKKPKHSSTLNVQERTVSTDYR